MMQSSLVEPNTLSWERFCSLARAEGLELYDVESPTPSGKGAAQSGVVRIFVTKGKDGKEGISLDDCTRLSHRILDSEWVEELVPGACVLEVSSPGINRKLRYRSHWEQAIGERVRVSYTLNGEKRSTKGNVQELRGEELLLEEEGKNEPLILPLQGIREARVDFVFGGQNSSNKKSSSSKNQKTSKEKSAKSKGSSKNTES